MKVEWFIVGCLALFAMETRADTPNNPFYKGQTVPGTDVSCCTKKDCQPLTAWRQDRISGEFEIYLPPGYWYRPQQNIIRHAFTPDGQAHACWQEGKRMAYGKRNITVFCVWIPHLGA